MLGGRFAKKLVRLLKYGSKVQEDERGDASFIAGPSLAKVGICVALFG